MNVQNESLSEFLQVLDTFNTDQFKQLVTPKELHQIVASQTEDKQVETLSKLFSTRFNLLVAPFKSRGNALVSNANELVAALERELDQIKRQLTSTPAYIGSDLDLPWLKIGVGVIIFLLVILSTLATYYSVLTELHPEQKKGLIALKISLPALAAFAAHLFLSYRLSHRFEVRLMWFSITIFFICFALLNIITPVAMVSNPAQDALAAFDSTTEKWSSTDVLIFQSRLLAFMEASLSLFAFTWIRDKFKMRQRPNKEYSDLNERHDERMALLQKIILRVQNIVGLLSDSTIRALHESEIETYTMQLHIVRQLHREVR